MVVIGAFPIAKLTALLLKQISKPLANSCKEIAKNHPFFRTHVLIPPARFYHWCEVKAKMWTLKQGKPVSIPVLSHEMAIELGASLVAEAIIFTFGAAVITWECLRMANKEIARDEKRKRDLMFINNTVKDVNAALQEQESRMKEIEQLIVSIERRNGPKPAGPKGSNKKPSPSSTPEEVKHTGSRPKPYELVYMTMPYPDRGIIYRSLNYIQIDVFSSLFQRTQESFSSKQNTEYNLRHTGIILVALNNIENEFRSLF